MQQYQDLRQEYISWGSKSLSASGCGGGSNNRNYNDDDDYNYYYLIGLAVYNTKLLLEGKQY